MRNLEQRIAEIDRRSKKIFKERKRRGKRILMACIPLVLCIGLCILPAMMTASSEASGTNGAVTGSLTGDGAESIASAVAKIEVFGADVSLCYTQASDILLISDYLNACTVTEPESSEVADGGIMDEAVQETVHGSDDRNGVVSGASSVGYTITLVMREGENTEYLLAGNTLKDRSTNQTYTLSQKQIKELKDLLGIPRQ